MKNTEIDMTEYIPTGYKNGMSRLDLRITTGLSDRVLRNAIEWTSERIEPIYSYNGRYFRVRNSNDIPYAEDYIRRERGRAKTIARRARKSEKFLEEFM